MLAFSAMHTAQAILLTLLVLSFYSLYAYLQINSNEQRITELEQQNASVATQLAAMQENLDGPLANSIANLKTTLVAKQRLLNSLNSQPQTAAGFSEQMAGLGRQSQPGLWLDYIAMANSGKQLELKGAMQKASLLPRYLQALRSEPLFSGVQFDLMKIEEQDDSSQLRFEIGLNATAQAKES